MQFKSYYCLYLGFLLCPNLTWSQVASISDYQAMSYSSANLSSEIDQLVTVRLRIHQTKQREEMVHQKILKLKASCFDGSNLNAQGKQTISESLSQLQDVAQDCFYEVEVQKQDSWISLGVTPLSQVPQTPTCRIEWVFFFIFLVMMITEIIRARGDKN